MQEQVTIKPKMIYLLEIVLLLIVFSLCGYFLVSQYRARLVCIIPSIIIMTLMLMHEMLPFFRDRILINDIMLQAYIGGRTLIIHWADVMVILPEPSPEHITDLHILTLNTHYFLPVRYFDSNKLLTYIQNVAPKGVLSDAARTEHPLYQEYLLEQNRLQHHIVTPLCVHLGLFLPFWTIHMNSEKVTQTKLWVQEEIYWKEVQQIIHTPAFTNLVLVGNGKQLALSGPSTWFGKDKKEMTHLLLAQIQHHKIDTKQAWNASMLYSKNVRIRT